MKALKSQILHADIINIFPNLEVFVIFEGYMKASESYLILILFYMVLTHLGSEASTFDTLGSSHKNSIQFYLFRHQVHGSIEKNII